MNRLLLAGACALWVLTACNVASVKEQPNVIPQNQCASDADCAVGSCGGRGTCRTTKGTFDTLLFEVTPPADATAIAGVQFLKRVDGVLATNGALDLPLDLLVPVLGRVTAAGTCVPQFVHDDGVTSYATDASDRTIPALVTLSPSSGGLGLFSSPIVVPDDTARNSSTYKFELSVPPGDYDIYVEPKKQPNADCPVPPQLLRNQAFNGKVTLNIGLPAPQSFGLRVSWLPADGALDGWTVDMLDSISGRAISNRLPLSPNAKGTEYTANLSYLPVLGDTEKTDQFIRLSPPDGVTAPTLLFARTGLGLFAASNGTIDQLTSLPVPVHVAGAVTARVTPEPVSATVTLVATKVTGVDPGVLASFVRTVDVGPDGAFDLDVLPGTYRVSAVPSGPMSSSQELAEASTVWDVGTSPAIQAGKVIELNDTLPITGVAVDPSGSIGMTGAQVQAVPSPSSIVTDVLHRALGEIAVVPRASSTIVDNNGTFKLKVDVGTYDFSVRPRSTSGFSWLVIPGIPVGTTPATSNGPGLNTLTLPLPVVYTGTVTVPGSEIDTTPIPGAQIAAYVYMKNGEYTSDASSADSVLQVALARSDNMGVFEILIPAALSKVQVP